MAWHLTIGLLSDKPSIGCAKTRLIGEYDEVSEEAGNYTLLKTKEETIGAVLRTRKMLNLFFISPGLKKLSRVPATRINKTGT